MPKSIRSKAGAREAGSNAIPERPHLPEGAAQSFIDEISGPNTIYNRKQEGEHNSDCK
jgi:hypothetical protein